MYNREMHQSFEEAYMCMVKEAHFLTDLDAPLVFAGLKMAQTLDGQDTPSTNLLTEFNRTCRHIIAGQSQVNPTDELSEFLKANVS